MITWQPLDGRPVTGGAPMVPPAGTVPARAPAVTKASTPCFFFSQGYCAKGDKCPFQHGGSTGHASSGQQPGPNMRASKTVYAGHMVKKTGNYGSAVVKMDEGAQEGTGVPEMRPESSVLPNKSLPQVEKKEGQHAGSLSQNGSPKGRPEAAAPSKTNPTATSGAGASSRLRVRQLHSGDERFSNGLKGEDCWEESSPGFDVLVNVGPDQMYDEGGQYQSGHEAEGEHGRSQRRGRRMYPTDHFDQYGSDYMGGVDQSGFAVGGQYSHGGYHEGYGHEGPDPMLYNTQGMPFGMRAEGPEGGRDRMVLNFEVEGGGRIGKDQKQMLKRQRSDGHPAGKNARRPRIEPGQDDYFLRRMQEEAQRSHEMHLRQQLVMQQQQGIGKGKPNNGRRPNDRLSAEMGRRLEPNPNLESLDRTTQNGGMGLTEQEMLKGESHRAGEGEKHRMDTDRRLQSEAAMVVDDQKGHQTKQKKEVPPTTFAGPKSLAQILAEKRKATAAVSVVESVNSPVESQTRDQSSSIDLTPHDSTSVDTTLGEERKIRLEKVVGHPESTKPVAFVGPKSLSDLLQAKRQEGNAVSIRSEITHGGDDSMVLPLSDARREVTNYEYVTAINETKRMNNEPAENNGDEAQNDMVAGEGGVDSSMEIDNLTSDAHRLGGIYEVKIDTDAFGLENKSSVDLEEDEEYTVDDEDDDFAKKLGGFFS